MRIYYLQIDRKCNGKGIFGVLSKKQQQQNSERI